MRAFAGLYRVHSEAGLHAMAAAFAAEYPNAILIEDTGDRGIQHVRAQGGGMRYTGASISQVLADITVRYEPYDMLTPVIVLSNRMLQGGDDVVMPLLHFDADYVYMGPGADHLQLNIQGTCGGYFSRRLEFGKLFWGSVPTAEGLKHGAFKVVREDGGVSYESTCCLLMRPVLSCHPRLRRCGCTYRGTTLTAWWSRSSAWTCRPPACAGSSMRGRATVLLRPLTHMLMLTAEGSNLQNEKQGQIRRNYYNT